MDQSLVGGSPWLIAATHVLHRHLAPRHPPLALYSLRTLRPRVSTRRIGKTDAWLPRSQLRLFEKMLVLAMQFSRTEDARINGRVAQMTTPADTGAELDGAGCVDTCCDLEGHVPS